MCNVRSLVTRWVLVKSHIIVGLQGSEGKGKGEECK